MKSTLTISRSILLFGLVTAVSLGAIVFTSNFALNRLKVGGAVYDKIKLGNDLVADILPPPEYVIEAYLEATLALQNPASLATRRDRLAQLKNDYDERREFWSKSDLEADIKAKLIEKSHADVQRFWKLVNDTFLPALSRSDTAVATKAYAEISTVYLAHRAVIDDIVKQTNDDNAATEAAATREVSVFTVILRVISGLVFALIGGGLLALWRGVVRPIVGMTGVMNRLAGGDTNLDIPALMRRDEVGAIARAVQVFKDNAIGMRFLESQQAELQAGAEENRKAAIRQVADDFEGTVGKIVETVSSASSEIETAAGHLTRTAENTQGLSATVAAASEQSSANVQSAAAASEQMASSVAEIGRQVHQAHQIAHEAVQQAELTNARMSELSQSADRIGEVVKTISAVAAQTNLLALNATIEAARAGEAGRGFAVVASEVKALASQTAKATEEIATQITQVQSATHHSVASIKAISDTIHKIAEISTAIAGAVEEQGTATQEITRNVQQAAQGAGQISGSIIDVNRGATETGSAAGQVHGLSKALQSESSRLKLEVSRFLSTVRVA